MESVRILRSRAQATADEKPLRAGASSLQKGGFGVQKKKQDQAPPDFVCFNSYFLFAFQIDCLIFTFANVQLRTPTWNPMASWDWHITTLQIEAWEVRLLYPHSSGALWPCEIQVPKIFDIYERCVLIFVSLFSGKPFVSFWTSYGPGVCCWPDDFFRFAWAGRILTSRRSSLSIWRAAAPATQSAYGCTKFIFWFVEHMILQCSPCFPKVVLLFTASCPGLSWFLVTRTFQLIQRLQP